jgi:hypothetical protein
MSNRNSNHNSLESMLREVQATTEMSPIKLNIINKQNYSQLGGSNYNPQATHNNSYNNVNKLLSMLADDDDATSTNQPTSELETQLMNQLKMKGGTRSNNYSNKSELEAFFRKYKINSVNGINTKYFINLHGGNPTQSDMTADDTTQSDMITADTTQSDTLSSQLNSEHGPLELNTTTEVGPGQSDETTAESHMSRGFSGGAGMNPGFQAFLNLKKKIAEELKISNGPKAAKIAGAVQKEMKAKYTNLNAVEIAAKGLEHFKKNYDKYKKMV